MFFISMFFWVTSISSCILKSHAFLLLKILENQMWQHRKSPLVSLVLSWTLDGTKTSLSIIKVLFLEDSVRTLSFLFYIYYLDHCFPDGKNCSFSMYSLLCICNTQSINQRTYFRILQKNKACF